MEPTPRQVRLREFLPRVASRSISEFLDDRCPQYAAAIAYHVLFSLFPLAIFLAGIFGLVVRATGTRADVVDTIVAYIPLSGDGDERLRSLLEGATGNLSTLGLFGILGVLYASSGMMTSIRLALNEAWDVSDARPFLRGKLVDVGLVFLAALFALGSLGLTIAARLVGTHGSSVGLDSGWVTWIAGVVVPLAVGFGAVLFLYRVVPAAEVMLRDAWAGALLAASVFVLLQNLFAVYVDHFANYNAIYGSLGAVVAFMFFIYLSSLAFLLGAEVASEWPRARRALEHGEVEEGPPARERAAQLLKGLWADRR